MKKSILFLLFVSLFLGSIAHSQTNKATVSYNLKKTFTSGSTTNVGGDLVIPDGPSSINTIPACKKALTHVQTVYRGPSLPAVIVDVTNSVGNGCVTLVVVTETGTQTESISASSHSGLLKFLKVKSIEVVIDRLISNTFPQTVESMGSVDIWF
jgi:hydrogenase maturation factor HypE